MGLPLKSHLLNDSVIFDLLIFDFRLGLRLVIYGLPIHHSPFNSKSKIRKSKIKRGRRDP